MARNKFDLNFDDFMSYADQISRLGDEYLKEATENAFRKSVDYVNKEIEKAMNASRYNFDAGQGKSQGRSKASLAEISKLPIEWEGTKAYGFTGVDLSDALEALLLAYGTPHLKADTKLRNALKVKGPVKKEVAKIQEEEFAKVIAKAMEEKKQ